RLNCRVTAKCRDVPKTDSRAAATLTTVSRALWRFAFHHPGRRHIRPRAINVPVQVRPLDEISEPCLHIRAQLADVIGDGTVAAVSRPPKTRKDRKSHPDREHLLRDTARARRSPGTAQIARTAHRTGAGPRTKLAPVRIEHRRGVENDALCD